MEDFIQFLKEDNRNNDKVGSRILGVVLLAFVTIVSLLFLTNDISFIYIGLFIGVVVFFALIITVSIVISNYKCSEKYKIKLEAKKRIAEMKEAKQKLEKATETCVKEFDKMKKELQVLENPTLNDLMDNYRNKTMIAVKQNHKYLKEVNELAKIVSKGIQLVDASKDVLNENEHLINLYVDNLENHLKTKTVEISEIVKTIEDSEKLKIKQLDEQYTKDINSLFNK